MSNNKSSEADFFTWFLEENQARRFASLLNTKSGRARIIFTLSHYIKLDSKFSTDVSKLSVSSKNLIKLAKDKGAPTICYVMSEAKSLDGKEVILDEAIEDILINGCAALVSCIPGKLGFYFSEDARECYLVEKD